ncbi:MAG: hypothetical protein P4L87_10395 [Formivibrio sp.]|nr:hypothetical protein [Formivibrio sp.]
MKKYAGIDIGFGNVKGVTQDTDGRRTATTFQSCVEPVSASPLAGFQGNPNALVSEVYPVVQGVRYRVATEQVVAPKIGRPQPVDDFQQSAAHTALIAAAMHSLDAPLVDVLALGTPVHTFAHHRGELERRFTGKHDHGLGPVSVRQVLVLPQPFGSLLLAQHSGQISPDPTVANVVIDPGYFSTDSLVATGLDIDIKRSHGVPVGAHAVYAQIAEILQQEFGARISRLDRIEHALRSGKPLTVLDRTVDLQRYLLQVQPLIQDTVNSLKARLGSHEDARIIVTGGGAALFFKAIKSAFPRNQVIQMVDPLRGNAEGFLIAARAASQRYWRAQ